MTWYINDLSLAGQYHSVSLFLDDLRRLMGQRQETPILMQKLFCSRQLHTRLVTSTDDFRKAVLSDRALTHPVLTWLTRNGPFLDDDRHLNPDDYFEHLGQDVTDQGLGEAARCQLAGKESYSFSFSNGGFNYTPVVVTQGFVEEPIAFASIQNLCDFLALRNSARDATPSPHNWHQMLEQAKLCFSKLIFSPRCIDELTKQPFSECVLKKLFELFRVLDEFMKCRNSDGTYTSRNHELIDQFFSGTKAWFTDESETNKHIFLKEMSFPDFENTGKRIFCSWHGKIKSPQYRIHFEWPDQLHSTLRVFYIGPKITKG